MNLHYGGIDTFDKSEDDLGDSLNSSLMHLSALCRLKCCNFKNKDLFGHTVLPMAIGNILNLKALLKPQ